MMRLSILIAALLVFGCITARPARADQKGHIELKMVVEQEVTVTNENGEKTVKRIEPKLVLPGEGR